MQHTFTRFISIIMALILLVQMIPVQIFATEIELAEGLQETAFYAEEQAPVAIVGEDVSKRTVSVKHYRMSDGSFVAVSYGGPIHYQDKKGQWQDINNIPVVATDSTSRQTYQIANGEKTIIFNSTLSDGYLFKTSLGESSVEMSLLNPADISALSGDKSLSQAVSSTREDKPEYNKDTTAQIEQMTTSEDKLTALSRSESIKPDFSLPNLESQIIYRDVYPGVDIRYTNRYNSIKEEIIIRSLQNEYQYSFFVKLNKLKAILNKDGSISLVNQLNTAIFHIPAPHMIDSAGEYSDQVHYEMLEVDGGLILTVQADTEWIEDPGRVLPISIDPTISSSQGIPSETPTDDIYSTYVHPRYPTTAQYGGTELYTGYSGSYISSPYITYLYFNNLPELPAGSIISEAQVSIYMKRYSCIGCTTMPVGVFPVQNTIPEGKTGYTWIKGITYNDKPEVDTDNVIDFINLSNSTTAKHVSWDITELVDEWYTGQGSRMVALCSIGEYDSSNYAWQSYSLTSYSYAPVMQVTYRNSFGLEDYYTYQSINSGHAGTVYIADATGQLKISKNLLNFNSQANPFSINLIYNSDYCLFSSSNYIPPEEMGLNMNVGAGWTLDCIQTIKPSADNAGYLEHRDGDGTVHYYKRSTTDGKYYDEEGLRLYIVQIGTNMYRLDDPLGSYCIFENNRLTQMKDADGNYIYIRYTDNRITAIVQKNSGGSEVTLATFTYNGNTVTTITDFAGNVHAFTYSSEKLASVKKNDVVIARYDYDDYRIAKTTDAECNYQLTFEYSKGKVSSYSETGNGVAGASVTVTYPKIGQTTYRDSGPDRIFSSDDDLLYTYLYDYAGRTINVYVSDNGRNVYSVSNAVYTASYSTDKRTNRILRSATAGVVANQYLENTGFELGNWTHSNTSVVASKSRTGEKSLTGNTGDASTTQYAETTTNSLIKDKTYTFSGYVNTEDMQFTGEGIYLKVTDSNGKSWSGEPIAYATTTEVDGGWARISVTFTPEVTGAHTVAVYRMGATGQFYADDFQLEEGEGPSSYNMVENGNMLNNFAWTLGTGASVDTGVLRITTSPTEIGTNAYQDIAVNLPGTQTFVFSGWAQANAAPNDQAITINSAEETFKRFGFRLVLTYSDGTTETHFVPCNTEITAWQYISYALIPQKPSKTVDTVRIACVYEQNTYAARFDNIALIQEVAQSRSYDDKGNLLSVTSTGQGTDVNSYTVSNLLKQKVTAGYGTYSYAYGTSTNAYRMTASSNNLVKETYSSNAMGNLTSTTISNLLGTTKKIVTSNTYSSDGNRVATATDAAGNTTSYAYDNASSQMTGLPTGVTAPNGAVTNTTYDFHNRVTQTCIASTATVVYNYSSGNLSSIIRTDNGSNSQIYSMTHDAFGNRLSVKVGSRTLANYTYAPGNGHLTMLEDGNGNTVSYTYDLLGRIKTATYSDGLVLTYCYTGEGNLHSVKVTGNGTTVEYLYNYDSLGRIVFSERKDDSASVLRARQAYDNVNRLISQIWQLGGDTYSESFTYNSTQDGSLNTHTTATGQTLTMGYDGLRRLSTVSGGIYDKTYTYRDVSDTKTTTQVASVAYDLPTDQSFAYTYDNMGNIATYTDINGTVNYTYDNQCQLTAVTGAQTYAYTYDTVGNILTGNGHTYTYGDTDWKDLLTAVDGEAITYDAIGNPTSYYNGTRWTLTWEDGKELSAASDGTNSISYTYDADGIRTSKTVNGVKHTYYYAGGKLLRETYGDTTLDFFYDANGHAYALKYNGALHYYITNLQGDVMQIVDANGNPVATYSYDPYGNVITAAGNLASVNPLRYRGYYYDTETGFYYLQSRYYDPAIGRFLNADAFASTGQGILGNNMFAYCLNNPVNYSDPSGELALVDDIIFFSAMAIVIVLIVVPPLPVLDAISTGLTHLTTTVTETFSYAANILSAKTKGKERIKDTGLEQESDEEISRKAHDNKLPPKERQRYKKEEKARGIRNRDKRMELYN